MKLSEKYKSYSLRKQRIFFLLLACLLTIAAFMAMPISAKQVGLPELSEETVANIISWGNYPKVSSNDPKLQVDTDVIRSKINTLQTALEETRFYRRTFPLNPIQWFSTWGDCLTFETDTGTYAIGHVYNRFFVEINGSRRYYKSLEDGCELRYAIRDLWMYLQDLEDAYYASTDAQ